MLGFFKKHKEEYSPEVQAVRDRAAAEMKAEKCGFICKTKKAGNVAGRLISEKEARLKQEAAKRKAQFEQEAAKRKAKAQQKYELKMRQKVEAEKRKREKIAKKLAMKEAARRERYMKLEKQRALKEELQKERGERKQLEALAAKKRNADLARQGKLVVYKGALVAAKAGQKTKPVLRTAGRVAKATGRVTVRAGKAGVRTVKKYGPGMVRDTVAAGKTAAKGLDRWADNVLYEAPVKRKPQKKSAKKKTVKGRGRHTSVQVRRYQPAYNPYQPVYEQYVKPSKAPVKRRKAAKKKRKNDFW